MNNLLREIDIDYSSLLSGKRVFVSSASQGIGKAIARLFAQHGAVIAFGGRDVAKSEKALAEIHIFSPDSRYYLIDLSEQYQIDDACNSILSDFGGIDILVNTVGVNRLSSAHLISDCDLNYMIDTNFKSFVYCSKAFVPGMIERKCGNIINISSIHSLESNGDCTIYAATKGAVNSLTRAMATDYAKYGIRVNAVVPGLIMSDYVLNGMKSMADNERKKYVKRLRNAQPLPPGQVQDIANAALFLASDMSAYITGETLIADGGAHACIRW